MKPLVEFTTKGVGLNFRERAFNQGDEHIIDLMPRAYVKVTQIVDFTFSRLEPPHALGLEFLISKPTVRALLYGREFR
jgi:hypothetical protein